MMDPFDVIALTPAAPLDPAVAAAACRAGARGGLDLEFLPGGPAVRTAVARLARLAPGPGWGVKLGPAAGGVVADLLGAGPRPGWVLLAGGDHPDAAGWVGRFRAAGVEVLCEAVSVAEAVRAVAAGADGIVLKGHESGGRVGADTAFVLVQKWVAASGGVEPRRPRRPFWVQGGIGPNTAAACRAAGARGVVLDSQLLLTRESPATESVRRRLAGLDGAETTVLGERLGEGYRVYLRPDAPAALELAKDEERLLLAGLSPAEKLSAWWAAVRGAVSGDPAAGVWPVGQDAALAAGLGAEFVTVAGVIQAVCVGAAKNLAAAARLKPLAEGSPLAVANRTKYPVLQGPMTRVSDTAAFAAAVADGGGLPFLALALFRKAEVEKLLAETKAKLAAKSWGVGILGFADPAVRDEQFAAVKAARPPFAVIAGGRPDQVKELEKVGTATYLHAPSPGLLRMHLRDGVRRFVFEGRECGGHVGPRSSFALWEQMAGVLHDHLDVSPKDDIHVAFAGGVHDALSGAMVAAFAAGLAERGVKVGAWLGTAYLFTEEAVETKAITPRFQREAVAAGDTVLLETGPGHAIRVLPTPYAADFEAEKARLKAAGKSPMELGAALERMNLGRLRVASKGVDRAAGTAGNGTGLAPVADADQHRRGMYMIGQVAALRDKVVTIPELHAEVCNGLPVPSSSLVPRPSSLPEAPPPCDVAIIGVSCFYPRARGAQEYWENILAKTNAVIEIPPTHWDWRPYYDPDPRARDKMISKWGGFMGDTVFDPLQFGITPKSIPNIEPLQLLLLEAVRQAVADAGYTDRPFARERTAAILGVGGGGMPLSVAYGFRACMPLLDSIPGVPIKSQQVVDLGDGILPEWTEDSFPGILLNVAAGRVANRFNLGGPNMAIDAACGSSLAALYAGVRELTTGTSDVAFVMGADCVQTPYAYVAFSKTHALSPKGRCRPFDAAADGIALAEGIGVAVLKRLADAERDGDTIYAVVKGIGASSDGRDKGLTAPRAEGQLRALERAYAQARVSPARVGLVEAHGTGTVVGDQTEAQALGKVFRDAGGLPQSCALGSVKSMIGHSKCAAGLAGLIKAAFALHHKVLPPTLAETPNPKANLDGGPLYLNTEPRPWVHGADHPRTAGVSAFGFGGTNFHTVLEEYTGGVVDRPEAGFRQWPAELFVWRRPDRAGLVAAAKHCRDMLAAGATPTPADLAASLWQSSRAGAGQPTLAVVATSLADLRDKLDAALAALAKPGETHTDPRGVYFAEKPADGRGKVAFLFPGQGSQYPDMLAQVGMAFPEVREVFDAAERTLGDKLGKPLGAFVYPPTAFGPDAEKQTRTDLQRTEVAQPALGAAGLGMARLLAALGVEPDLLAGHSYGEYVALAAAGAMTPAALIELSHRRGEVIRAAAKDAAGGMVAVDGPADAVTAALKGVAEVWPANSNSPTQTVVAGTDAGLLAAADKLTKAGLRHQRIPVACGFHSPLIAGAKEPLAGAIGRAGIVAPTKPVFSNTTAAPHAADPAAITAQLAEHLAAPVRFRDEIEAMYTAGTRVFVECGPQGVLTALAGQTLAGKPHLAVAADQKARPGLVQLAHLLGQLLAHGVPADLDRLFAGRGVVPFDPAKMTAETGKPKVSATAWVVNGVRSRPIHGPEPRLLGQALPENGGPPAIKSAPAKPVPAAAAPVIPPKPPAAPAAPPRFSVPEPIARRATMTHPDPAPAAPAPYLNGHAAPARPAPAATDAAQVMARFQDVMARFLDTQRSVMLGFLGVGGQLPAAPPPTPLTNGYHPAHGNGHSHSLPAAPVVPAAVAQRMHPAPAPSGNGHPGERRGSTPPSEAVAEDPKPAAPVVIPDGGVEPRRSPVLDRDALLAQLLDLVSDRTGYPKEALSIDLDLEADLGIDSIKRVEILGTLADGLGTAADGKPPALEMEKLSVLKTLRGIADYLSEALDPSERRGSAPPSSAGPEAGGAEPRRSPDVHPGAAAVSQPGVRSGEVQRLVVRLVDAPLPARPRLLAPAGIVVLTDDGLGVAQDLADHLAEVDVRTVLVRHGADAPAGGFAADLSDPAAVAGVIADIKAKCGPVAGLLHLLPLAEPPAGETPTARTRREVKSLYLLARGLEADLRAAGPAGGAVLLAATGMGGRMGYGGELPETFFAGHGGVAGFTKCLGHEWPEVTVRAVDIDPETSATTLAEQLLSELGDPAGPFEIGRRGPDRVTWQCEPGPLDPDLDTALEFGPTDTVLITGGARGITAKIAAELGRRGQPKLVLVGSSAEPAAEPADTAELIAPADIKAVLLKRLGAGAKPATAEAAFRRLMKDREIRANLAAIRATGATVDYRGVDVKDPAAFGALLDELKRAGDITAVIHGAGVIDDKLVRDKTPESFERVFGTKVDSALTLAAKLDPAKLKAFALFASITSRYGNRGQADYAAANEVLSKLAARLDEQWPARVFSIAWGPWAEVGMVADLEKHLTARGLKLIEPAVGAKMAADELQFGPKGEPEVVIAGGTEAPARRVEEAEVGAGC